MVTRYEVLYNDITKYGNIFPVVMVPFREFIQAKKDTYKRFYKDDGTYHFTTIPEKLLHITGDPYCMGLELTGSSGGTEKNKNMSLITAYCDKIITAMEDDHVRL